MNASLGGGGSHQQGYASHLCEGNEGGPIHPTKARGVTHRSRTTPQGNQKGGRGRTTGRSGEDSEVLRDAPLSLNVDHCLTYIVIV